MRRSLILLCGSNLFACHFDDDPPDPDTDTDGIAQTCAEELAAMVCEPGTTKLWTVDPGSYDYTNIDQVGVNGEYDGISNGIVLGGSGSSIVTQVIDQPGCFGACVLDNPCDGHTPSLEDLENDTDAEPTPSPPACVVSPANPYGIDEPFCYYCGVATLEECEDFALACGGFDPDNPPPIPDDGGVDDTGGSDDGGLDETGDSGGAAYDCTEWNALAAGAVRDGRGVVYLPEPVAYYAAQQDGLDMAQCDGVRFGLEADGISLRAVDAGLLRTMGLAAGDRIVAFNGEPIQGIDQAFGILADAFYSGTIHDFTLRVDRRGHIFTVPVVVH